MAAETKPSIDIALAENEEGHVIVHRADCQLVRKQAAQGFPVATFFGCEAMPGPHLLRHECLKGPA